MTSTPSSADRDRESKLWKFVENTKKIGAILFSDRKPSVTTVVSNTGGQYSILIRHGYYVEPDKPGVNAVPEASKKAGLCCTL